MLSILSSQYPEDDLFFLLGADSFRDLPRWHNPVQLIRQATLVVMERSGIEYDMAMLEAAIPGLTECVIFEDAPLIAISSSDIRARIGSGRSIRYLLPMNVETYIHTQGLYRTA
jgi:nicotinate-nucleotide adenylyltransferase